jgi:hypothetical protein
MSIPYIERGAGSEERAFGGKDKEKDFIDNIATQPKQTMED